MQSKHIRICAYTDIHHHEYTNGLTGEDVEAVEQEFSDLVVARKADLWVFGGDRFLSRNPQDISRKRADSALTARSKLQTPGIMLVGNHDRWAKSPWSGHNLYIVDLHQLPNVSVLDTVTKHTTNINELTIAFHAVPAGHKIQPPGLVPDPNADFNIVLFHDIVKGCKFTNGIEAPEGVDSGLLDVKGFDIILGGDNHQRQNLNFKNTIGLYVGAPLQHNWGDVGSERGFLIVDLFSNKTVKYEWIESKAPRFLKEEFTINSDMDLPGIIQSINTRWANNIVRATLCGPSTVLSGLQIPKLQDKFLQVTKARQIKLDTQYTDKPIEALVSSISARDDQTEWFSYLELKKAELLGLDIDKIKEMGLKYIIEADHD
jgi:DNA repair exonuclease SbcCD nuclease subunit